MSRLEIMYTGAEISACSHYRYDLWRRWGDGPYVLFIGLNPSTADASDDDPTIRRCKRFVSDWGYSAMHMANLFAYRATNPKDMLKASDPIGIDNDTTLASLASRAGVIVCAWGAMGGHMNRDNACVELLSGYNLKCLGVTKAGQPRHPLYIKADRQLEDWLITA